MPHKFIVISILSCLLFCQTALGYGVTLNMPKGAFSEKGEKATRQDTEEEDQQPDDTVTPGGRADNLSGIVRLKGFPPVRLAYERRAKQNGQGDELILTCENSDFCDYSIKSSSGTTNLPPEMMPLISKSKVAVSPTVGPVTVMSPPVISNVPLASIPSPPA